MIASFACGVLATGCASSNTLVEAPMVSADVAARAAAPVTTSADARSRTSTARRADALLDRGDRFAGHYVCAQGRTEATLVIEDLVDGTDVSAIFEFDYPGGGGDHAPASGSFRMHGSVDPGTGAMHLDGDRWIEEPDGYVMVSLLGTVSKTGSISGTVKGPGCSSFYLEGSARGAAKRSAGLR